MAQGGGLVTIGLVVYLDRLMEVLVEHINRTPLAGLMLVVTLGYLLGRPAWRGVALGPAGGTLLVALGLGHFGLDFRALYGSEEPLLTIGGFGFALFIYSVGFEAGAGFLRSLRTGRGWRMVAVGVVVNVLAVVAAIGTGAIFALGPSATAGVLAGAMTSAPTYAAVSEVCGDSTALSVAFALTYPFGLVAMVLLVQTMPRLVHADLAADADEGEESGGAETVRLPRRGSARPEREQSRAFRIVKQNVIGKTLAELDLTHRTGCLVTRVLRGDTVLIPNADTRLESDDHILAVGRVDELRQLEEQVGPEVWDEDRRERLPPPRRIEMQARAAAGRSLAELRLIHRYGCSIVSVDRQGAQLEPSAEFVLERGDVLEVIGPRAALRGVAAELGRFEPSSNETDIAVYAGGILLGVLLGSLRFRVGEVDLGIGMAGGLLLAGLVLSGGGRIRSLRAYVPLAARQLVRDLGILLFVAETGVSAGRHVVAALSSGLWQTLVAGAIVTLLPILGALFVGRKILRMRSIDTWGSVAGGMTSTAALLAVKRAADSDEPAVSYATAFAVSSVLVTMAGHVVVFVMT